MGQNEDNMSCSTRSWIMAAIAGVVIALLLMVIGDWRFFQALFAGVVVAIILGFLLIRFRCGDNAAHEGGAAGRSGAAAATGAAVGTGAAVAASSSASSAARGSDTSADAGGSDSSGGGAGTAAEADSGASTSAAASAATGATTASKAFQMQPSKPLAGQAELAARKGEWKYDGGDKAADTAKKPAKKTPAKKAAAPKASADKAAGDSGPVMEGKPETLDAARAGGADDLKRISGVGPKLEGTLNEMGFWHFDQIASWGAQEIAWVDSRLKFKGRIERDDWMSQARTLADGGEPVPSKSKK